MDEQVKEQEQEKSKAQLDAEFSDLYRAHLRDVYSYAYYRIGNHHDAEDLTEQTFLQAYRHFERAQRESRGRPLRPWSAERNVRHWMRCQSLWKHCKEGPVEALNTFLQALVTQGMEPFLAAAARLGSRCPVISERACGSTRAQEL